MKLRKRQPVNYFGTETAHFNELVYCDTCCEYVFQYCSLHGPLLVIPDNKVSLLQSPPPVPRAALTIPHVFLHLAPSIIPGAGLGVFSTLTLPRGVRFGPYRGRHTTDVCSTYSWQLHDENMKRSLVIDAGDANDSNWMRYVNCARHWNEQNLVAYQYRGQIYYRTVKTITRFTELMVFYGSESASSLGVDLHRYNMDEFYTHNIESLGTNTKKGITNNAEKSSISIITKLNFGDSENQQGTEINTETTRDSMVYKDFSNSNAIFDEEKPSLTTDFTEISEYTEIFNTEPCHIDQNSGNELYRIQNCFSDTNIEMFNKIDYSSAENYCRTCKKYVSYNNLINHMQIHSDVTRPTYSCDLCQYVTKHKRNVKRHKNTVHKNIVHYKNTIYEKNPVHKNIQHNENIVHKKVAKQFACEICSKQFLYRYKLTRHKLSHSEEKLFKCKICAFGTNYSYRFKKHEIQHFLGDVYRCNYCTYFSARKVDLIQHLKKNH